MSSNPDSPVVLTSVRSDAEASIIVAALAREGIEAQATGGFTSGFQAEAPGEVRVLVHQSDLEAARSLLDALTSPKAGGGCGCSCGSSCESPSQPRAELAGMEVAFNCEDCGKPLVFPAERCGYVEVCKHCGQYIDVPDDPNCLRPVGSGKAKGEAAEEGSSSPENAPMATAGRGCLVALAVLAGGGVLGAVLVALASARWLS